MLYCTRFFHVLPWIFAMKIWSDIWGIMMRNLAACFFMTKKVGLLWVGRWKVGDLWSRFGVSSKSPTTIMGRDQGARIEPFYDNKDSHADGDGGCSVRRCLWEHPVCNRRNDGCRLGGNWPISYRKTHCQPVSFGVGKMMLVFFSILLAVQSCNMLFLHDAHMNRRPLHACLMGLVTRVDLKVKRAIQNGGLFKWNEAGAFCQGHMCLYLQYNLLIFIVHVFIVVVDNQEDI